jgi:hypothetical protein
MLDKTAFESTRYGGGMSNRTPRASRNSTTFVKNPINQPVDAGIENKYVKNQMNEYYKTGHRNH